MEKYEEEAYLRHDAYSFFQFDNIVFPIKGRILLHHLID